jgi:hypothetical protein
VQRRHAVVVSTVDSRASDDQTPHHLDVAGSGR